MSRELDRQIAINFTGKQQLEHGRDRGFVDNALAWETFNLWDMAKPGLGGWSHCKDNIWVTENLPHYSEDLNLAIKLTPPECWELLLASDDKGSHWICSIEEWAGKTIKNYPKKYWVNTTSINPAEAICLARLKLKEEYGI